MKRIVLGFGIALLMASLAAAQQVADTEFRFQNPSPAYERGAGPQVCIDEAHHNFHTATGRYLPFAELLRGDGYQVRGFSTSFGRDALRECKILVISNAVGAENQTDPSYPHLPAFTREEITALFGWIREGGALLLVADHAPYSGAASALANMLGVQMLDGYAGPSAEAPTGTMIFGTLDENLLRKSAEAYGAPYERLRQLLGEPGLLGNHSILSGRNERERITSVATFTGHAFYPSTRVEPLLRLGPRGAGVAPVGLNLRDAKPDEYPVFSLAGWLQAGAVRLGSGRAVLLGEAAVCTAQRAGQQRTPMGMNVPFAPQNAQFCLNIVRWLSGALEGQVKPPKD
jgi:hypothetical protein